MSSQNFHLEKVTMFNTRSGDWRNRAFYNALLASLVILVISTNNVQADDVPAFFLKIAKNIPRVGRSEKFEDMFLKPAKSMPGLGRHEENAEHWPSYEDSEHFQGPSKRRMDYPSTNSAPESWTWQHFPLAIEGPRELWRALAGYSKDPVEDMDNEIWKRKKRTEEQTIDSKIN